MPFHVSGQLVTTKSSRVVQVAGCDGAFVDAAGAAFVTMSSAADACEHVASKRREPVIAVRQAVQAIVPSCRLLQIPPNQVAKRPLSAAAGYLSIRRLTLQGKSLPSIGTVAGFVCRSRVSPKADIHRAQVARSAICRRSAATALVFAEMDLASCCLISVSRCYPRLAILPQATQVTPWIPRTRWST